MDFYRNFVDIVDDSSQEQVYALCPFHKEKVPSFTINTNTHEWFCHGCGEGGGYVKFLMKFLDVDKSYAMDIVNNHWNKHKTFPFPQEKIVNEAFNCLKNTTLALQLIHSWGVTDKIIDKLRIGYSKAEKRFYFPIYSSTGYLVNIRKYMPPELRGTNNPKCIGIKDCNYSRFWPIENLENDTIVIVEGEKDALCAIAQGLNAVTGTGGSTIPEFNYSIFKDKKVYIMTDNDDAGDKTAQKYIDVISLFTNDIKRIKLPVKDFTDYYLKYGDANVLQYAQNVQYDIVENAEVSSIEHMSLTENESVDNMDKRVLLDNMIVVGSDPKTYAIPSVICMHCECAEDCKKPCKLSNGKTSIEYAFNDRELINMIDSSDKKMLDIAYKHCSCKKVSIKVTQYVNAQRIIFQEKASLLSGLTETSFEPRYGFYMYDKDRLTPTAKYIMDATKVTDPRTQKVFYSIKHAKVDDSGFKEPVDKQFFQNIYNDSNGVIEFLENHYRRWEADCRVYGRLDLFSAFLTTMCSVTEIPYRSGVVKGTMDVIAIGDTRTGKSLLAQNMLNRLDMGGYINGENAKLTGVLGGVVRLGDSWLITWGAIPLNDKGFLAIDEATGLSIEDITQMSSVRSGCVATINKVVRGEARARTRLFWISNPRSGRNINEYFYKGFGAFREFIPVNEDQARFDLVIGASRDDIDTLQSIEGKPLDQDIVNKYRNLINYAWNVDSKNIKQVDYSYLYKVTTELCKKYAGGTLLIKEAAYEKILRVAAALSVLTCSIDDHDQLIISNKMISWAADYISYIFEQPSIAYNYYVSKVQEEERLVKENTEWAHSVCDQYPALRVLLNNNKFKGTQMAEVLGLDRDSVSKLLAEMLMRGLIKMTTGGLYTPSATLLDIVRKMNGGIDCE